MTTLTDVNCAPCNKVGDLATATHRITVYDDDGITHVSEGVPLCIMCVRDIADTAIPMAPAYDYESYHHLELVVSRYSTNAPYWRPYAMNRIY